MAHRYILGLDPISEARFQVCQGKKLRRAQRRPLRPSGDGTAEFQYSEAVLDARRHEGGRRWLRRFRETRGAALETRGVRASFGGRETALICGALPPSGYATATMATAHRGVLESTESICGSLRPVDATATVVPKAGIRFPMLEGVTVESLGR